MKKMEINLTVIIPVYNGEKYISRLVHSIQVHNDLKQEKIEILLVDDGSTDKSEKICKAVCQDNDNIMYLKKTNGGIASARNFGLNYARGKYVTFADQDDIVVEGYHQFIEHCVSENLDILYTSPYHKNEMGGWTSAASV